MCDGQCEFIKNEKPNICIYNGKKYALNSEWKTKDCRICKCSSDGVGCCISYSIPDTTDLPDCIAFFDEKGCVYRVVRKDNPCNKCEFKVRTIP
ncbi:beta-microseminoprotein-like [Pelobates fuscus]|uniref:beta-microseminoprotein-like n=1 Tax=Pelobates fuscus TaxID=191477 RepID=UPI002FE473AB